MNTCACSMCFLAGFMSLFVGFNLLEVFGLIYKRFQIVGFLLGFSVLVILWVWLLRKCKKRIENLDF